jgi:cytochrome c-type biogenesis protein CcmH/NrfF
MHLTLALVLATALTPQQSASVKRLENGLIAPCCYTQSIAVHMSGEAEQMRHDVTEMVAGGMSEQQVYDHYKAIYGEQILMVPDGLAGRVVFSTPLAVFVAALVGLSLLLRKFVRARPPAIRFRPAAGSDEEWQALLQRVRSEVEKGS